MTIESTSQYQWSNENKFDNDIHLVIAELKSIADTSGEVTLERIVETSKSKKSSLHKYFEWDNNNAAHKWRLHQANVLLNRIEVRIVKDGEPKYLKAYNISSMDNRNSDNKYATIDIDNPNVNLLISFTMGDINRSRKRLELYERFSEVRALLDKAIEVLSKESTETKDENKPALNAVA